MLNALILAAVVLTAGILLWPRVANAKMWRATITPLASIIGSGFLILGPVPDVSFGQYAPLAMLALCAVAYLFGSAIRFDIGAAEGRPRPPPLVAAAETQSGAVLAFAYFISDRSTCFRPQWFPLEILFVHYQSVALAQRILGVSGGNLCSA